MSYKIQITCINKDSGNHNNPLQAISHYGWVNAFDSENKGKWTRSKMVSWIEEDKDNHKAFVKDSADGSEVYCYVRTSVNGVKFLQTKRNDTERDNLLSLDECR